MGSDIVPEILSDFENNQKLGFIFPETYYQSKESALKLNSSLVNSMNYLINQMFEGHQIGKSLDFPAGDMFWAKIKSIYQETTIILLLIKKVQNFLIEKLIFFYYK